MELPGEELPDQHALPQICSACHGAEVPKAPDCREELRAGDKSKEPRIYCFLRI